MRVCVHWPRLGPYHLARLRAVYALCEQKGSELVALETAPHDSTYDWILRAPALPFRHECVFPDTAFEAISAPEMMDAVARQLDAINPDAVAITSYSTADAQASLLWCRRNRRVAVMMFDSRAEDTERTWWREAIKRLLVRQFDAALVAGAPQRAYAEALGMPPSHVFTPYDVVDNAYFARKATSANTTLPGLSSPRPFFLTVARLTEVKGLPVLLDAHRRYRAASASPWRLVIVGDGPDRSRLEDLAACSEGVTFAGFRQLEDLPDYYGRASALVFQTTKDTWGLAVNEAMACGLPVLVSSGAGCAQDLVDSPRNGATFDPSDPDELANTLAWMSSLTDAERQAMGARSREILRNFRPEDFAAGLWSAIQAGRERSDRSLSVAAATVLATIRRVARSSYDFHSIPD